MRRHNQTDALLVELLIVILFFMLGSTILIRVFGASHTLTGRAEVLAEAMAEAQNVADTLYCGPGEEEVLSALGFSKKDDASADAALWIRVDENYELQVTLRQEPLENGVMNRLQVQASAGEEVLITLPCSRYEPRTEQAEDE